MGIELVNIPEESKSRLLWFLRLRYLKDASRALEAAGSASMAVYDLEFVQQVITKIMQSNLGPPDEFVRGYARVAERHAFLWKWVYQGVLVTTLPSVDPTYWERLVETKVLGVMFDVLLDDVADEGDNADLLAAMLRIPYDGEAARVLGAGARFTDKERRTFAFTVELWRELDRRFHSFPRHAELKEVLEFDYRQLLNVMRYAWLVNHNLSALNLVEHDLYQPHNMHMMISGTLDLMCSPTFDIAELGELRECLWRASMMGRIGNMVTTWEREVPKRDFTSGVFAYALQQGLLDRHTLRDMPTDDIREVLARSGIENRFIVRWRRYHDEILTAAKRVRSLDLRALVQGLERLFLIHLGSRGLK